MTEGHAYWTSGVLETVNENRRRNGAYLENPQWERDLYNTSVDVVMDMILLKGLDDAPIGAFTWFAVHPGDFNEGGDNPLGKILLNFTVSPNLICQHRICQNYFKNTDFAKVIMPICFSVLRPQGLLCFAI